MIAFILFALFIIVAFVLGVGYLGLVLLFVVIGFFKEESEQTDKDV